MQEIGAYMGDELVVLVQEIGDGLEFGIELDTLLLEFQVSKTELGSNRCGPCLTSGQKEEVRAVLFCAYST